MAPTHKSSTLSNHTTVKRHQLFVNYLHNTGFILTFGHLLHLIHTSDWHLYHPTLQGSVLLERCIVSSTWSCCIGNFYFGTKHSHEHFLWSVYRCFFVSPPGKCSAHRYLKKNIYSSNHISIVVFSIMRLWSSLHMMISYDSKYFNDVNPVLLFISLSSFSILP